jgi:amino acid adenylation domain-containing protein
LAHYLHRKGITTGNQVALCLERSTNLVIGILAVLKAGAAYVPIDTSYPAGRIAYMLEDSGAMAVLSTMEWMDLLPGQSKVQQVLLDRDEVLIAREPVSALLTRPAAESLAYVIYTSGSTGRPKGAGVYHQSIVNLAQWYSREFSITPEDRNIIISSPGFDLTQKNFFGTLMAGGTIVIPAMSFYDSRQISRCIQDRSVTIINCAPNAFYPMAEEGSGSLEELASLRLVVLGGEPINLKRLERWITSSAFHGEIVNSYGPTECTDIAAYYRIREPAKYIGRSIPIGKPNDNVQLYVLNEGLQLQPFGVTGELYISGDGVGAGYLNDKALTASKFISNPYGEGLLYRTGDLVRRLADGNIEYLGRTDEQVKIRGYRIELAEIENVLLQSGLVTQAVVLAREDGHGNKRLYAYVVPSGALDKKDLLSYVKSRLPEYMAPSYIIVIDRMPLTGSGKIDKKMLLGVAVDEQLSDQYVAPRTNLEMKLVSIWERILRKEHIGINDNFFELGGHSIMAIQMLSLLEKELGIQVPVSLVFKYTVIQLLAEHIHPLINNAPYIQNEIT